NGILHCDLKPGNILVTRAEGRAKVIDFGIARAIDDSPGADSITRDLIFGSPPYVSPEMMDDRGRSLDTRTDVYALGLILYELAVGTLPFRVSSTWLLMLQIAEKNPESPSARFSGLASEEQAEIVAARGADVKSLVRSCRGDLDAIVLKAIDRDPDRRYSTAAELAADLRRYLADEPTQARAPTSAELLGRYLRRHKQWAIGVILLFAVLSAGLVARTIEARRANSEAERANAEAERASAEAERAQVALAESEQIRRFLIDLFQAANPEKTAGRTVTVDELLEEGSERLRTNLIGQPLVRASLLQTVGSIHTELGEFEEARALVTEAAKIRSENLPAADPLVVESQIQLGIILRRLGRYEEAEPVLYEVREARRADPDVDPELLAQAHSHLGVVYWRQDRFDLAEMELRAAWTLRQEIGNSADIAESANNLGVLLQASYRYQEAQVLLAQALEVFQRELGPKHPRVAGALNNLGLVNKYLPTWADAESLFRQASEIFREAYGQDHFRSLLSRRNLVDELARFHRWDETFQEARDILRISEDLGDPIALAGARGRLGRVEIKAGFASRATRTLRRCVAEAEAARGPEHSATLACRTALAEAMARVGEIESAILMLRDLRRIRERLGQHRQSRLVQLVLGETMLAGQRFAEAEGQFVAYIEALERASEPSAHSRARGLMGLGRAFTGQGRFDEAAESLLQALAFRSEIFGSDHPLVSESAHELGLVEIQRGRPSRARELLQRAVAIRSEVYPPGDPDTEASLEALRSIE
ncbi:MAG: serine/threonine-protein kinase, partial [Holophagales bacterium]|nr:serine/threonine-protein kinase [Holophagales bacterium]